MILPARPCPIDMIPQTLPKSLMMHRTISRNWKGTNATSAITTGLSYDSSDRAFNTTQGQDHSLTYTYAGIGGDIGFNKVVGELGWYIPVYKGLVTFLHGKSGYVREIDGYTLPDYEKFYLGGLNSIRGFGFQDINIKGVNSAGEVTEEGGEKFVQFNFELTYPFLKIWALSVLFSMIPAMFSVLTIRSISVRSAKLPATAFDGILPSARFALKAATFWIRIEEFGEDSGSTGNFPWAGHSKTRVNGF
jgi:hypothetical protein